MESNGLQNETSDDTSPPATIGRYELRATIGQGGMGAVYKAYDPVIKRLVALKTITIADPDQRARFQQEARIAGRLNHPNIVMVYDVGEEGDLAYIVMELIEGQTLADRLPLRLPWPEAVKLILPVCQALDYAHQQGIIHRDVKPANILIASDGRVKLSDFGIARLEDTLRLTQTGLVLGTPLYIAPEQITGETVDERADLFPLGVILLELITGRNPFAGEKDPQGLRRLMDFQAVDFSLLEGVAPPTLQAVVRRAMAEERADRLATAAAMVAGLTSLLDEDPAQGTLQTDTPTRATASASRPQVEFSSEVILTQAERKLLAEAFQGYDRLYVEGELSGGSADTRLLVALPIRSGRPLTRVILKLASPEMLNREWAAYQEHVAGILPAVIADIQTAPYVSPDGKLGLLRYTFIGDTGEGQAGRLSTYYKTHRGAEVAALLQQRIFQAVAPNWWLNRKADFFLLQREYDHLLPAHAVIEQAAPGETQPLVLQAGVATNQDVHHLETGQRVQLKGFHLPTVHREQGEITLSTSSPAEPLRFQLTGLSPEQSPDRPGDAGTDFVGAIVATRHQRLSQVAQAAFPTADLSQLTITIGEVQMPNPLTEYEGFLERRVSGMHSIIHGNLTLENILVEPQSGVSWLIDFAHTRQGHNLYDLLQLETQVVTQLLPLLPTEAEAGLDEKVIQMAKALHSPTPPTRAPHPLLQKPYELLRTIRQQAGQCMRQADNWNEYYPGLVIMLLGTLPSASENLVAARFAFIWAAMACDLVDRPLSPPMEEKPGGFRRLGKYNWLVLGLVAIALVSLIFWRNIRSTLSTPTPVVAAVSAPSPSPTSSPSPTATLRPSPTPAGTPTPIPGPVAGVLVGGLNIYSGPGTNYTIVGTAGEGTAVQITGRNTGGDWLQIAHPAAPGGYGWVEAQFVRVDATGTPPLPVAKASPPPTATPTPTDTPPATATATATTSPTPTMTDTSAPAATPTPSPTPAGTPTASAGQPRQSALDAPVYPTLLGSLALPPVSLSFSPDGRELAVTEGIKLYTVARDGSYGHIWMEEDETIRPVEGVVWSPDGQYLAFMADHKQNCTPCRVVGLVHLASGQVYYLEPPPDQAIDLPRWTQDGRLLVTVHGGEPASGVVYIYDTSGRGTVASGSYVLSSSHDGQQWFPWEPGKTWRVGQGQPNRYYDQ